MAEQRTPNRDGVLGVWLMNNEYQSILKENERLRGEVEAARAAVEHLGGACDYSKKVEAVWTLYHQQVERAERAEAEVGRLREERDRARASLAFIHRTQVLLGPVGLMAVKDGDPVTVPETTTLDVLCEKAAENARLSARVRQLQEAAEIGLRYARAELPDAPRHSCGPESACDNDCAAYAYNARDIQTIEKALSAFRAEKGEV